MTMTYDMLVNCFGEHRYRSYFDNDRLVYQRQNSKGLWYDCGSYTADGYCRINKKGVVTELKPPLKFSLFVEEFANNDAQGYGYYDCTGVLIPSLPTHQHYMRMMEAKYPTLKYYFKKWLSLADVIYLPHLYTVLQYIDIPETESLLFQVDVPYTNERKAKAIAIGLLSPMWKKINHSMRVNIINFVRKNGLIYRHPVIKELGLEGMHNLRKFCYHCTDVIKIIKNPDVVMFVKWGRLQNDFTAKDMRRVYAMYQSIPNNNERFPNFFDAWRDYLFNIYEDRGDAVLDPYWRYNRNFLTLHAAYIARQQEREALKEANAIRESQRLIAKKYASYDENVLITNDIKVFTSSDREEWKKHAHQLHQCILANKYYSKKCFIVFLQDMKGNPLATAEIKEDREIGQFLRDEHIQRPSAKNIPEYMSALNEYLDKYYDKFKF